MSHSWLRRGGSSCVGGRLGHETQIVDDILHLIVPANQVFDGLTLGR